MTYIVLNTFRGKSAGTESELSKLHICHVQMRMLPWSYYTECRMTLFFYFYRMAPLMMLYPAYLTYCIRSLVPPITHIVIQEVIKRQLNLNTTKKYKTDFQARDFFLHWMMLAPPQQEHNTQFQISDDIPSFFNKVKQKNYQSTGFWPLQLHPLYIYSDTQALLIKDYLARIFECRKITALF